MADWNAFKAAGAVDYTKLGQTLAYLSAAVPWATVQPLLQSMVDQLSSDAPLALNQLGDLVLGTNFTQIALLLKNVNGSLDSSDMMSLMGGIASAVDTNVLGSVLIGLSEAVQLYPFGLLLDQVLYDYDSSKSVIDFAALGAVVASLPTAVNLNVVGQYLNHIAADLDVFGELGTDFNNFTTSLGQSIASCNRIS